MAFSTVLSVEMICHEYTSTTGLFWAFSSQTSNLSVFINLVVLQYSKLDLLSLVLDLLWSGVVLLLSLLSTTSQSQYKMKSWLFLDIVITESATIFKLLPSKDQSLLVRWDTFLVLDLGFYIINCITGLNLKKKRLFLIFFKIKFLMAKT